MCLNLIPVILYFSRFMFGGNLIMGLVETALDNLISSLLYSHCVIRQANNRGYSLQVRGHLSISNFVKLYLSRSSQNRNPKQN